MTGTPKSDKQVTLSAVFSGAQITHFECCIYQTTSEVKFYWKSLYGEVQCSARGKARPAHLCSDSQLNFSYYFLIQYSWLLRTRSQHGGR